MKRSDWGLVTLNPADYALHIKVKINVAFIFFEIIIFTKTHHAKPPMILFPENRSNANDNIPISGE